MKIKILLLAFLVSYTSAYFETPQCDLQEQPQLKEECKKHPGEEIEYNPLVGCECGTSEEADDEECHRLCTSCHCYGGEEHNSFDRNCRGTCRHHKGDRENEDKVYLYTSMEECICPGKRHKGHKGHKGHKRRKLVKKLVNSWAG